MKKEGKYKIKFLLPSTDEWLSLKTELNSDEEKRNIQQNKENLNQYLLSAMQMQNFIVLAGSGASLSGEDEPKMGPSMWELWEMCTKNNMEYKENVKKIFKEINYDIEEKNNENIEALLSQCEAYLQIKESELVTEFINNSKKTILDRCSLEKTDENLEGHKNFVHKLSRRRTRDSRLKLFTTNYDTCFEEAASKNVIMRNKHIIYCIYILK